jgi:hypothetical protein
LLNWHTVLVLASDLFAHSVLALDLVPCITVALL